MVQKKLSVRHRNIKIFVMNNRNERTILQKRAVWSLFGLIEASREAMESTLWISTPLLALNNVDRIIDMYFCVTKGHLQQKQDVVLNYRQFFNLTI
jgi:hypothetical protein